VTEGPTYIGCLWVGDLTLYLRRQSVKSFLLRLQAEPRTLSTQTALPAGAEDAEIFFNPHKMRSPASSAPGAQRRLRLQRSWFRGSAFVAAW